MKIPTVTLSHYSIDGVRYHQVLVGSMPVTRETENATQAADAAARVLREILNGTVAGTSPRRAMYAEWDGDLGEFLQEPGLVERGSEA